MVSSTLWPPRRASSTRSQRHSRILPLSLTGLTEGFGLPTEQEVDERRHRSPSPGPDRKMPRISRGGQLEHYRRQHLDLHREFVAVWVRFTGSTDLEVRDRLLWDLDYLARAKLHLEERMQVAEEDRRVSDRMAALERLWNSSRR
ncbi:hypothetical protein EDD21DRAFT_418116 [Dissophora ornata]|nr:hypothetical protein EDD21DRAFT_418116 [Dissophora ornata]